MEQMENKSLSEDGSQGVSANIQQETKAEEGSSQSTSTVDEQVKKEANHRSLIKLTSEEQHHYGT